MPSETVEINATPEMLTKPLIWRLGKLYNVVTRIKRARVTEDYGFVTLMLDGSTQEVNSAVNYLKSNKLITGGASTDYSAPRNEPENDIPQPNTIFVRLNTVSDDQAQSPVLYRLGKDFGTVIRLERAAFDEEVGGSVEVAISGDLSAVQRAIAYLHTTGINVNPRQRSVTDGGNL